MAPEGEKVRQEHRRDQVHAGDRVAQGDDQDEEDADRDHEPALILVGAGQGPDVGRLGVRARHLRLDAQGLVDLVEAVAELTAEVDDVVHRLGREHPRLLGQIESRGLAVLADVSVEALADLGMIADGLAVDEQPVERPAADGVVENSRDFAGGPMDAVGNLRGAAGGPGELLEHRVGLGGFGRGGRGLATASQEEGPGSFESASEGLPVGLGLVGVRVDGLAGPGDLDSRFIGEPAGGLELAEAVGEAVAELAGSRLDLLEAVVDGGEPRRQSRWLEEVGRAERLCGRPDLDEPLLPGQLPAQVVDQGQARGVAEVVFGLDHDRQGGRDPGSELVGDEPEAGHGGGPGGHLQ